MTQILVIDDEEEIRQVIAFYLKSFGYEVATANDGDSGIELCRSMNPTLVLCDLRMPGMDGLEVLSIPVPVRWNRDAPDRRPKPAGGAVRGRPISDADASNWSHIRTGTVFRRDLGDASPARLDREARLPALSAGPR